MKHLFVTFVSLFLITSMVQAEPQIVIPGQPFKLIGAKIDETNVKIETVKSGVDDLLKEVDGLTTGQEDIEEDVEETKEILEETKNIVEEMHDTSGGSCNWVSPHWSIQEVEWGEYWKDNTIITIYNPKEHVINNFYVIVEDEMGNQMHRKNYIGVPGGWSIRFQVDNILPEPDAFKGIIRIESYWEVLVEGEILTVISNDNGYVGSHSRTMTWHPVKGDCKSMP